MHPEPADTRTRILEAAVRVFAEKGYHRPLAKIVLVQAVGLGTAFEERRRAINDRFTALIQARLEKGIADGSLPAQNAELAARAWVGALNEIVIHWIYTGTPDLETAAPEIKAFLLRSIGARNNK